MYMRLSPPQVWLRQYWSNINGFNVVDVHPMFLIRKGADGVSYALMSHVARFDSIGATTKPIDRIYSHHHNCRTRNGKQLPVYDDIRRVGLHQYWFVVLYVIQAPLKDIMLVESALQQILLPTSNMSVRSKSLPASKILTGFRPIMRLRGVKKNTWREQRKPQTFVNVADGRSTLLLSEILSSLLQTGFSSALVKVIPGDFSMQMNIQHIWKYRFSSVQWYVGEWASRPMPLIVAMRRRHWAAATEIHILSLVTAPEDAIMHKFCWMCIRKPIVLYNLRHITPDCMLGLYRSVHLYLSAQPAQFLKTKIDSSCKHRYGFMLSARPTLKIPRDKSVSKATAAKFLHWLIEQLPVHQDLVSWFKARARVVFTAPISLGQILLNHRKAAKDLDKTCPPKCTCAAYALPRNEQGCVEVRGSHPAVMILCGPLVAMNLNTKLFVGKKELLCNLKKSMELLQDNFVTQIIKHDVWAQKNLAPWIRQQCDSAIYSFWQHSEEDDSLFSCTEAYKVKEKLSDFIVLPLDRNINAVYIMCPLEFWVRFKNTFWDNHHYTHLPESMDHYVSKMRTSYMHHGFHKITPLPRGGSLGSAYILPKNKNPVKVRPIVNTTKMPSKKMSSIVSAVLILLISKATNFLHFNLSATKDLKAKLQAFSEYFTKFSGVNLFSFDVNNMYTVLKHDAIFNALYQFMQLVRARLKSLSFHIYKYRKRKTAKVGKNPGSNKFYTIKFHQVPKFVMWELEFMIFFAGNQVLQQTTGIAMGGCCSPAVAQILCIYCELQWLQSLGADSKYIRGVRFMDDSLIAIVKGKEHIIQSYIHDCYPPECTLEGKLVAAPVVPLLETAVHVFADHHLVCVHVNKNTSSIIDGKYQCIVRYTHKFSSSSTRQVHAAWNGVIARMVANTSPGFYFNLWWPCWAFFLELRHLGFSWDDILRFVISLKAWKYDCPPQWCFYLQLFFRCLVVLVESFTRMFT
jgi:hypothetical protein